MQNSSVNSNLLQSLNHYKPQAQTFSNEQPQKRKYTRKVKLQEHLLNSAESLSYVHETHQFSESCHLKARQSDPVAPTHDFNLPPQRSICEVKNSLHLSKQILSSSAQEGVIDRCFSPSEVINKDEKGLFSNSLQKQGFNQFKSFEQKVKKQRRDQLQSSEIQAPYEDWLEEKESHVSSLQLDTQQVGTKRKNKQVRKKKQKILSSNKKQLKDLTLAIKQEMYSDQQQNDSFQVVSPLKYQCDQISLCQDSLVGKEINPVANSLTKGLNDDNHCGLLSPEDFLHTKNRPNQNPETQLQQYSHAQHKPRQNSLISSKLEKVQFLQENTYSYPASPQISLFKFPQDNLQSIKQEQSESATLNNKIDKNCSAVFMGLQDDQEQVLNHETFSEVQMDCQSENLEQYRQKSCTDSSVSSMCNSISRKNKRKLSHKVKRRSTLTTQTQNLYTGAPPTQLISPVKFGVDPSGNPRMSSQVQHPQFLNDNNSENNLVLTEQLPLFGSVPMAFFIPQDLINSTQKFFQLTSLIQNNGGLITDKVECFTFMICPVGFKEYLGYSQQLKMEHMNAFPRKGKVYSIDWLLKSIKEGRVVSQQSYEMFTVGWDNFMDLPNDKNQNNNHRQSSTLTMNTNSTAFLRSDPRTRFTQREIIKIFQVVRDWPHKRNKNSLYWKRFIDFGFFPNRSVNSINAQWQRFCHYPSVEQALIKAIQHSMPYSNRWQTVPSQAAMQRAQYAIYCIENPHFQAMNQGMQVQEGAYSGVFNDGLGKEYLDDPQANLQDNDSVCDEQHQDAKPIQYKSNISNISLQKPCETSSNGLRGDSQQSSKTFNYQTQRLEPSVKESSIIQVFGNQSDKPDFKIHPNDFQAGEVDCNPPSYFTQNFQPMKTLTTDLESHSMPTQLTQMPMPQAQIGGFLPPVPSYSMPARTTNGIDRFLRRLDTKAPLKTEILEQQGKQPRKDNSGVLWKARSVLLEANLEYISQTKLTQRFQEIDESDMKQIVKKEQEKELIEMDLKQEVKKLKVRKRTGYSRDVVEIADRHSDEVKTDLKEQSQ